MCKALPTPTAERERERDREKKIALSCVREEASLDRELVWRRRLVGWRRAGQR